MSPTPKAYYNENDPFAAAWLRNLIAAGLIADGEVDERSIEDVFPIDLVGYTQCHFFAGIGGWSYAARLASWPDSRPLWTGSCPCQPFSAAGQGAGFDDERHLWPAFFHLVEQRHPPVIFGEQVASKAGLAWLDLVQTDLEAAGYAAAAVDLCAASIGTPHIRQRLFWCANSMRPGRPEGRTRTRNGSATGSGGTGGSTQSMHSERWPINEHRENGCDREDFGRQEAHGILGACGEILSGADSTSPRPDWPIEPPKRDSRDEARLFVLSPNCETGLSSNAQSPNGRAELQEYPDTYRRNGPGGRGISGQPGLASAPSNSSNPRRQRLQEQLLNGRISIATMEPSEGEAFVRAGYTRGFWAGCDWWHGRDQKFRPIEPGVQPLASGISKRMGKLRGYGNSIVAPLAAEFIKAHMDCCPEDALFS